MNKADELRAYLNNAYGMEKEWPKTFQVGAATYGEVCQAIFNHIVDDNMENNGVIDISIGPNNGIMFKNVELILKELKSPTLKRYVTCHIQKDKRITLGTCVHKYLDCPSLKNRTGVVDISGSIVQKFPKCYYCYNRAEEVPDAD